jgi:hypothetical protein
VPDAARRDPKLGEPLALVDALRIGDARPRHGRQTAERPSRPSRHMNIELLELAAALDDLLAEVARRPFSLREPLSGRRAPSTAREDHPERRRPPPLPRRRVPKLLRHPRFIDGVHGALLPDAASQERAEAVVLPAIDAIIRSGEIRDTGRRIGTARAT